MTYYNKINVSKAIKNHKSQVFGNITFNQHRFYHKNFTINSRVLNMNTSDMLTVRWISGYVLVIMERDMLRILSNHIYVHLLTD